MSPAALSAIRRCYSILQMDASSLRFQWAHGCCESWRATFRRRREMLNAAGAHMSNQYADWDDLAGHVRESLAAALEE